MSMSHDAMRHTPPYSCLQEPAEKGQPCSSLKVDTRAGGNVLPLHVFQCLYPDQISPASLPTGLDHISTRLTAYNGSHIPLYGALHSPITWKPEPPWCLTPQGNLILVHCRHPWPHHPGSTLQGKANSCEDELWHYNHMTWHKNPHVLHLFPQQEPQPSLLQPLKQPSPSGPLMPWSRSSQINSWALADYLANIRSDSIMMPIP